jgi:hypothetical protein
MRWLIIALLASVAGLLVAAAGMARHILRQRKSQKPASTDSVVGPAESSDVESGS